MRIALVTPEFGGDGGGIHTFYRPLVSRWSAQHECFVIVGAGMVAEEQETRAVTEDGTTVVRLGVQRLQKWRSRFARYAMLPGLQGHLAASWAAKELADEFAPDVTEVTDFSLLFAAWVADAKAPYVVQSHGSSGQISKHDPMLGDELLSSIMLCLEGALLTHASVQTYSSSNAKALLRETGAKVSYLPPAWEHSKSEHFSTEHAPDTYRVFGRLQRWKGPDTLASALKILGTAAQKCEWYGRDVDYGVRGQPTSAVLTREYPEVLGKTLALKPPVSQSEVHALQASALCNIVPSLWDMFNFTAVEAMASGRPVICSRGAGASELLVDGETGFLFDSGDANGLANAMSKVQDMTEPQRRDMGDRARTSVLERLDPDYISGLRIREFERLIQIFQRRPLPDSFLAAVAPEHLGTQLQSWAPLDSLPMRVLGRHLAKRVFARLARRTHA